MAKYKDEDVHIEQFRRPRGVAARAVIDRVTAHLLEDLQPRRRDTAETLKGICMAVVSDLVYRHLEGEYQNVITPTSLNRTRYDFPPLRTRQFKAFLKWIRKTYAVFTPASVEEYGSGNRHKYLAATLTPGSELIKLIEEHGPTRGDFRVETPELVVVRMKALTKVDHRSKPQEHHIIKMDYEDTQAAKAYRAATRVINKHLADMLIEYVGNANHPDTDLRHLSRYFIERPTEAEQRLLDAGRGIPTSMKRAPSLALSGRYYGGFWETMEKRLRWHLRINGEQVVEVDWSSLFLHLAYHSKDLEPPPGDLYAIPGLEGEDRDDTIKPFINAMFNYHKDFGQTPGDLKFATKRMTAPKATKLIKKHHKPIADLFGTSIGLYYMNKESNMMTNVLLTSMDRDIPLLPLHDGVICGESNADSVARLMLRVYQEHNGGHTCPVTVERRGKKIKRYP